MLIINLLYNSGILLLGIYQSRTKCTSTHTKNVCTNVHSSIIQKVETTQMSTNWWMDKWFVTFSYDGLDDEGTIHSWSCESGKQIKPKRGT